MNLFAIDTLPPLVGAIFFDAHHRPSVPFQVLSTPLLPVVFSASTHPTMGLNQQLLAGSNKSPFRIVPIPSINRTQPEELPSVSCST